MFDRPDELGALLPEPAGVDSSGTARHHVEQSRVQPPVGISGEVDHRCHRPLLGPVAPGPPDVLINAQRSDSLQPFGPADAGRGLASDRPPQRVPTDPQMPRQRRDRRVVVGQGIDRPADRATREHCARRDQLMLL